jgi:predicted metal-dependent hydrolase
MITIDKIIRSKRKTIAIILEPDGKITVRAPLRLSRVAIEQMVAEKADWVHRRQEQLQKTWRQVEPHTYRNGEIFYYLGDAHPLEIVDRAKPILALEAAGFRMARSAQNQAPKIFETWFRREARRYITGRVEALAKAHGCSVKSLRITGAQTRWGSCGSNGTLNFTWRLIMAPKDAIDYVIIHELVHLEIRNHSRQFWEKVKEWDPDYAQQRAWLKANAWLMK